MGTKYPVEQCADGHCTCFDGDTDGHANLNGIAGRCCFCHSLAPVPKS